MKVVETLDHRVGPLWQSTRIDAYLAQAYNPRFSRNEIKQCLVKGTLTLNGKVARPSDEVREGDRIEGQIGVERQGRPAPESIPIRLLYEDEHLIGVDKPRGMVVHPGAGNRSGTLVNALLGLGGRLADAGDEFRPGIVHRLDKETTGVLLVAKDNESYRHLQRQFAERSLTKTYLTLVRGRVEFDEGRIAEPIGRDGRILGKMAVVRGPGSRDAETHYRVLERYATTTLVEARILTGRTHQIRVHMAHLGYPVVGDRLYGRKGQREALALHARSIEFEHPGSGERIKIESPVPEDFARLIEEAKKA